MHAKGTISVKSQSGDTPCDKWKFAVYNKEEGVGQESAEPKIPASQL